MGHLGKGGEMERKVKGERRLRWGRMRVGGMRETLEI